ncbi:MAG: hypothetical protein NXY57DRAFT_1042277 [Lentinula lateritia]|nr:MAG: hypothetical protein NXY57DRAFT_1042277 [Lentinula lateritia]
MVYFLRSQVLKGMKPLNPKAPFNFLKLLKESFPTGASSPDASASTVDPMMSPSNADNPSLSTATASARGQTVPGEGRGDVPASEVREEAIRLQPETLAHSALPPPEADRKLKKKALNETGASQDTLSQVLSHGAAVEVDLDASELEAARGAHTGKPGKKENLGSQVERERQYSLEELLAQGFEHIEWDGRTPIPIVDRSGCIIAVLAGQPGSDYEQDLLEAFKLFSEAGEEAGLGPTAAGGR